MAISPSSRSNVLQNRRVGWLALGGLALAALALAALLRRPDEGTSAGVAVDRARRAVEFAATVDRAGFERGWPGMPGYHLIVWKGGRAAGTALFRAEVTDVQVIDALESLGARPGDRLPMATWDRRADPAAPEPDLVIAGPAVEVLVEVPGRPAPLALSQVLDDAGGRGFAMRFGGHRANIPQWHSGCIACLYSCPGSKVGNARYTVRDYGCDEHRFRVRPGALPADGSRVAIVLRLAGEGGGKGS
jgi:hypothetical protein